MYTIAVVAFPYLSMGSVDLSTVSSFVFGRGSEQKDQTNRRTSPVGTNQFSSNVGARPEGSKITQLRCNSTFLSSPYSVVPNQKSAPIVVKVLNKGNAAAGWKVRTEGAFRGVRKVRSFRYIAEILDPDHKTLGMFVTAEEAARAYDAAASELHGAKANLNFPLLLGNEPTRGKDQMYFRGVREVPCCRYVAEIQDPDRMTWVSLGMFVTEEEAAMAYDAAAREFYVSKAKLNFPLREENKAWKSLIEYAFTKMA
ncbi:hypothetical protein Vadar_003391 [Vaccinium darrowii]|uniref:Uncharacterized protein n=1 Tax=Vaccinium darrowii TaxID=229202 RepID=A0ACB7YBD5_9ERIC|nr:hypothetical protein Vadar_003391 [Vaccinium darrowii]